MPKNSAPQTETSHAGRYIRPGQVKSEYPFSKGYVYQRLRAGDWRSRTVATPGSSKTMRLVYREDIEAWIENGGAK